MISELSHYETDRVFNQLVSVRSYASTSGCFSGGHRGAGVSHVTSSTHAHHG